MTYRSIFAAAFRRACYALDVPARIEFRVSRAILEQKAPTCHGALAPRNAVELALRERALATHGALVEGPVLIDAMWRNPGYWLRASLLRAALGTAHCEEVALTGRHKSIEQAQTARALGIRHVVQAADFSGDRRSIRTAARELVARTRTPEDILAWNLPCGMPAKIVYDSLLKAQRSAAVDVRSAAFERQVAEILGDIERSARLLDSVSPGLVIVSHVIQSTYGSLAWQALSRGIQTVLAFGNYGVPRYYRLRKPDEIFDVVNMPDAATLDAIPREHADRLAEVGAGHVRLRLSGATDDLGAHFAFRRATDRPDRASVCARFGWDPETPIIAVYAANWFDFPHACGMEQFRDYLDWLNVTLAGAQSNRSANWLFRAHPADLWYGGVTLADLMPANGAGHIRLCPTEWNGAAVADFADGVVTVMGTAGVEYACLGKPALIADRGWYSRSGIGVFPGSRQAYIDALGTSWWSTWNREIGVRRASIMAGIYFGRSKDRAGIVAPDDTQQDALYEWQSKLLTERQIEFDKEVDGVREWWGSSEPSYHVFKMLSSKAVDVSNVDHGLIAG
jgi:hypothetical protein